MRLRYLLITIIILSSSLSVKGQSQQNSAASGIDWLVNNRSEMLLQPVAQMSGKYISSQQVIEWSEERPTNYLYIVVNLENWKLTFFERQKEDCFQLKIKGIAEYVNHNRVRLECIMPVQKVFFELLPYDDNRFLAIVNIDNSFVGYICK